MTGKQKKILILGGTGTLGNEIVKQLGSKADVTIFSRDELKQYKMKSKYPDCKYVLGDIRQLNSHRNMFRGVDTVFHVAALKHVDMLEENIAESIKTNIIPSIKLVDICRQNKVSHCVFSSTDKAVYPINVYGNSKAISEKIFTSSNTEDDVKFLVYRWGNVIGSNGSVINQFIFNLKNSLPITITDKDMTRFWISIEEAVSFMLATYESRLISGKKVLTHPLIMSANIMDIVDMLAEILRVRTPEIKIIGKRLGEKLHEDLKADHEGGHVTSKEKQFSKQELREFLERYIEKGGH